MPIDLITHAIPASLCRSARASWPSWDWPYWHRYQGKNGDKYGSMDRLRLPPACIASLDALARVVIPYLGDSFIDYDLHAAGMHMMPPGGFLSRHLDAECHPLRNWVRTHSIVLFLNEEWNPKWGGELRLESDKDSEGDTLLLPAFGQAVIFTTAYQWHEVLPVLSSCPDNRMTLALFAWREAACEGSMAANFSE